MSHYTETTNYYNDHRVQASDRRWWNTISADRHTATITREFEDENGDLCDEEVEVAVRWEICPTCNGRGSHVNPSIDCDGLTGSDFAEDPDFAESYMEGLYDQPCNECHGDHVVPVCDDEAINNEIEERRTELQRMRLEEMAERRMGA